MGLTRPDGTSVSHQPVGWAQQAHAPLGLGSPVDLFLINTPKKLEGAGLCRPAN
jgi:hypothetical protein